jgi:predicted enzyme related to lactoylglutathione lyase
MNQVQVEQKTYQMPPQDGFTVAHFLTVADIERSLRFYETVFGGRILSRGDSSGAPGYIQIANTWLLVNPGGGPTPDKPSVTLSVPANPDLVSSFMNIRVADIQACYDALLHSRSRWLYYRSWAKQPGRCLRLSSRTRESIWGDHVHSP